MLNTGYELIFAGLFAAFSAQLMKFIGYFIKNKKFDDKAKALLINEIKSINDVSACGFINPTKGLLHLNKEEGNE